MRRVLCVALTFLFAIPQANAWGNRGHELVAYIAYKHLDPSVRAKVDILIQSNPCIQEWKTEVAMLPEDDQPLALFMLAATWPDRIKLVAPIDKTPYDCQPGFKFDDSDGVKGVNGRTNGDVAPNIPQASQNIGYGDTRRHKYWHFIDKPVDADGVPTQPEGGANVLTELILLSQALSTVQSKELKSYDLVWVEHLTGDIHQPLHDAQRFSNAFPGGDAGGNQVHICNGTRECRAELHAYWDDLPGSEGSLTAVMNQGRVMNEATAPTPDILVIDHPDRWVEASLDLAKKDAYAPPFQPDEKTVSPAAISPDYHSQALKDMNQQIFLAGHRLAALLNNALQSVSV